jgi:lipopolysaccharide transport system permease protein
MKGLLFLLNPRIHLQVFGQSVVLLYRFRQLIWEMTKAEISKRYVGQTFGTVWAIVHPAFLIAVYVFVFSYVFRSRFGGTADIPLNYTAYLLSGLIPWLAFSETLGNGPSVILSNVNLVKQHVFPVEVLPIKEVLASSVTLLIAMAFMIVYVLWSHGALLWSYFLLPAVIALQILAMVGVCYILSAVGVYFRDLKDFIAAYNKAGLFLIPVLYLPTSMPNALKVVLHANPFSYMVWCYQDVLFYGRFEHPTAWAVYITLSLGVFYAGYRIFKKLRTGLGDVL